MKNLIVLFLVLTLCFACKNDPKASGQFGLNANMNFLEKSKGNETWGNQNVIINGDDPLPPGVFVVTTFSYSVFSMGYNSMLPLEIEILNTPQGQEPCYVFYQGSLPANPNNNNIHELSMLYRSIIGSAQFPDSIVCRVSGVDLGGAQNQFKLGYMESFEVEFETSPTTNATPEPERVNIEVLNLNGDLLHEYYFYFGHALY